MDDLPIFRCLYSLIYNQYVFFKLTVIIVLFSPFNALSQEWVNKTPDGFQTYTGFFINDSTGWLGATKDTFAITNSFLLFTKDGAETFKIIYTFQDTKNTFLNLFMVDSLIGYATVEGFDEFFWKTRDGGYNWENITDTSIMKLGIGPIYPNSGFYFLNQDTGFFGGVDAIFRTTNGGESWLQMNTPITGLDSNLSDHYHINELCFYNAKYGWAACSYAVDAGFGMKTTDGGYNWEIFTSTGSTPMWDVHSSGNQKCGIVGMNSFFTHVYLTQDNFNSFSFFDQAWDVHQGFFAKTICYQNDSIIWISGTPAKLARSNDSGLSFSNYLTVEIPGIDFPGIQDIQFFNSVGYAYGIGFLLGYKDTLSDINANEENVSNIELWPNPTNDIVTLHLQSIKYESVRILLISAQGQNIKELESILNPGLNSISLSLKDEPSGLYFLIIQENDRILHRKIIKH